MRASAHAANAMSDCASDGDSRNRLLDQPATRSHRRVASSLIAKGRGGGAYAGTVGSTTRQRFHRCPQDGLHDRFNVGRFTKDQHKCRQ